MGLFSDDSEPAQAYNTYQDTPHKADLSHELIASAAAYEAARAYEKHVEANGQPASHNEAKALIAGFAGGFIDREVEEHGLDFLDKEKAKYDARQQANQALADSGQY